VTPLPAARSAFGLATLGRDLPAFVRVALEPVRRLAETRFRGAGAARLLAGNALHADFRPESPLSGFFGWLLCSLGQDVGYPFPRGGAGELTAALVRRLEARGGTVTCSTRVEHVVVRDGRAVAVRIADGRELDARRAVLADVAAPSLFLRLLDRDDVAPRLLRGAQQFVWDWATVKVDWALDGPIPWTAAEARRAPVVHIAEDMDELSAWAAALERGVVPREPFVVLGQYAMGDETRAPAGKETAWAYTHVPQRARIDTAEIATRIEARVEELAPGFGALVLARHVAGPNDLERANENLVGGAINGGTAKLRQQLLWRPPGSFGRPETGIRGLYLASASAHPGGGVHGGPGAIAARCALRAR
jgi:phytoene dehydrogenase-like protein